MSAKATRQRRKASQGATRKVAEAPARQHFDFALWLNRLLVLSAAAVVVVAAVQAWLYLDAIPVEQIRVTGQLENLQREQVQEMIQPALVGGFLSADLRRVKAQLETLPWVYEVTVRRRWPSALEVHVVEQLPIARWGEEGFLNHRGEVFQTRRTSERDSLPALRGPEGSQRLLMARYLRLLDLLQPLQLRVSELAVDARGQLQARLEGGMLLVLGNSEFLERVQRFTAAYPQHLAQRRDAIERVDLRYESGFAVAFAATQADGEQTRVAGL